MPLYLSKRLANSRVEALAFCLKKIAANFTYSFDGAIN